MSEEIEIRVANKEDAGALVSFNLRMAKITEGLDLDESVLTEGVNAVLDSDSRGFYVVAEDKNQRRVVGGLLVGSEWSDWRNGWYWWIASVFVEETHRNQGVYRRMYEFVKKHARSEGNVHGFRLYVEIENLGAQRVYENVGMIASNYLMFSEETDNQT